jgi:hypothetical protein
VTERRRPLENDDGQGALFGGEAFAPSGPAPAWKRPQQDSPAAPSADAPPFEASVEADVAVPRDSDTPPVEASIDAGAAAPQGFEPAEGDSVPRAFESGATSSEFSATPSAFESGADPAAHGAGVTTPSPFADEIAELERATDGRAPRSPRAPLAGPTLDDVMSRAWEGLATGLPAACPVCHGEVVVATAGPPRGRCPSCGTTIE